MINNLLTQIFSIKNQNIHKVITILGLKFKFKSKKLVERKRLKALQNRLDNLAKEVTNIKKIVLANGDKIQQ